MLIAEKLEWIFVAEKDDFIPDNGSCVKVGNLQIAIFYFERRNEWYATDNMCPHKKDMVLSRGLIGDSNDIPKVACPMHKKTFSLKDGTCLSGEDYQIKVYPIKEEDGKIFISIV